MKKGVKKPKDKTQKKTWAYLSGLSLLLKLLELLCCDKADWFVSCYQLGASRHRGQDDVPAQTADTDQTQTEFLNFSSKSSLGNPPHPGKTSHTLSFPLWNLITVAVTPSALPPFSV